jgi:hypothetical protein
MADKWEMRVHDGELQAWFKYAGYKARDAREPFRRIAFEVILPAIEEQFATEGDRSGDFWEDLTEPYGMYKARQGCSFQSGSIRHSASQAFLLT